VGLGWGLLTVPALALKDWGAVVEKYSMLLFSPQVGGLLVAGLRSLLVAAAATPQAEHVSWEEVSVPRAQPMQGNLQLVLQFHSIEHDWEPYCTPFSDRTHLAVRAWSDSQLPWVRTEYNNPRARYFVRRGTFAERLLARAATHERIVVVGHVRAQFLGQPWIEVVAACSAREQIPLGTVLHASRAIDLLQRKAARLALEQFKRALAAPLPAHAREALLRLMPVREDPSVAVSAVK
jgi:hypothetical protein